MSVYELADKIHAECGKYKDMRPQSDEVRLLFAHICGWAKAIKDAQRAGGPHEYNG